MNPALRIGLALDLHVERNAFRRAGQRAHHGLHAGENFSAALLPVGPRFHRCDAIGCGVKLEQVFAIETFGSRSRKAFTAPSDVRVSAFWLPGV